MTHDTRDNLLEFSVAYTDRSLNHMSGRFRQVMLDLSHGFKEVYSADGVIFVPGSGTYGMEAVARQFATQGEVLIVRNGYFSYRWGEIIEKGAITPPERVSTLKAYMPSPSPQGAWAPPPVDVVSQAILRRRPNAVFLPHVDTSSGILLPDRYIEQVAQATRSVGGVLVLDCIASGAVWVDMRALGVDVLISAPQKGWSSAPGCAIVCLSERAMVELPNTQATSYSLDLAKWLGVMQRYEGGGHAYHATMPTMTLMALRDALHETQDRGLDKVSEEQWTIGHAVRALLEDRGFASVAAAGFEAPGVVVSYTADPDIASGKKFLDCGIQIAAGVPLMCDEPKTFTTFRVGLFGLDKLGNIPSTLDRLRTALDCLISGG